MSHVRTYFFIGATILHHLLIKTICVVLETHCVLEIEVKGVKHRKNLYDFRGNAFLRRDGSLQGPLKARQVQEWTRMVRLTISLQSD